MLTQLIQQLLHLWIGPQFLSEFQLGDCVRQLAWNLCQGGSQVDVRLRKIGLNSKRQLPLLNGFAQSGWRLGQGVGEVVVSLRESRLAAQGQSILGDRIAKMIRP